MLLTKIELDPTWGWLCELELSFNKSTSYPIPGVNSIKENQRRNRAKTPFVVRVCKGEDDELYFADIKHPNKFLPLHEFLPIEDLHDYKLHRGHEALSHERAKPLLKHWSTKIWHINRIRFEDNPWSFPDKQIEAIPTRGRCIQSVRDEIALLLNSPKTTRLFHKGDANPSISYSNNPSVLLISRIHNSELQALIAFHSPGSRCFRLYRVIGPAHVSPIDEYTIKDSNQFEHLELFEYV